MRQLDSLKRDRLLIMLWFKANDYIVNKVFLGEWSEDDPRYIQYKKDRITKRAELDDLNLAISHESS